VYLPLVRLPRACQPPAPLQPVSRRLVCLRPVCLPSASASAVTQVVVYIGGVLILVLFTVMMTRLPKKSAPRRGLDLYVPAGIFSLALFALLYRVITSTDWPSSAPDAATATVTAIGTKFMTDYIFPFEYASLVILVAMIGAAILIRERKEQAAATTADGDDASEEPSGEEVQS